MTELIYITPEYYGSCYVVRDPENAILFDPGMAWHAPQTIAKVRDACQGRVLRAIYLTHSHYDHISALPYFKKAWPGVPVYAAAYVQKVLGKASARATMKKLSEDAALSNGTTLPEGFDEDLLTVDLAIADGDTFDFGEIHMEAVECIGHTKDSYSYVINDHMMIASETLGMIYTTGCYEPQCLVSFIEGAKSLEKCSHYNIDCYAMPHLGPIADFTAKGMWDVFKKGLEDSKNQILGILRTCPDFEAQIKAMDRAFLDHRGAELIAAWPYDAFYLNAQAMLKTIAREEAERQGA